MGIVHIKKFVCDYCGSISSPPTECHDWIQLASNSPLLVSILEFKNGVTTAKEVKFKKGKTVFCSSLCLAEMFETIRETNILELKQ